MRLFELFGKTPARIVVSLLGFRRISRTSLVLLFGTAMISLGCMCNHPILSVLGVLQNFKAIAAATNSRPSF